MRACATADGSVMFIPDEIERKANIQNKDVKVSQESNDASLDSYVSSNAYKAILKRAA